MKKFYTSFFPLLFFAFSSSAQKIDYKRPSSLGISFILNDYVTAQRLRNASLSGILRDKQVAKFKDMSPGLGLSYFKGLTNHVDFAGTIAGSYVNTLLSATSGNTEKFLVESDASVNLKLLTDRYLLTPYLSAGVGVSLYNKDFGAFIPVGAGLKFNFFNEAALFLSSQYRIPVTTDRSNYHFFNSVGIAGIIGTKKEPEIKTVVIPEQPKDSDGDSILDENDKCPTVPGVAKYAGCPVPDTDGDGINDDNDQCPSVAGVARYNGCPVPDTDKDGINDEEDKCKDVRGVARFGGCPVPDSDNDGINDEEDKCPQLPGTRENNGCPEIKQEVIKRVEYAAKNVYFATGSAKLLPKSFKSLNDIVALLSEDANLKLVIEGHTDDVGAEDYNQTLSENRAASVRDYFTGKGVSDSRLSAQGYGESKPIADNKTAAGKAKNRRVVLAVNY